MSYLFDFYMLFSLLPLYFFGFIWSNFTSFGKVVYFLLWVSSLLLMAWCRMREKGKMEKYKMFDFLAIIPIVVCSYQAWMFVKEDFYGQSFSEALSGKLYIFVALFGVSILSVVLLRVNPEYKKILAEDEPR